MRPSSLFCVRPPTLQHPYFCRKKTMGPNAKRFVEHALWEFSNQFTRNRKKDLTGAGLENRRNLIQSITSRVQGSGDDALQKAIFTFYEYGRIQDMKPSRVNYRSAGGEEMIERLKNWAGNKNRMQFVKGRYAEKFKGVSDARLLHEIAWGTLTKLRQRGKRRQRKWWNTGKERDINTFYNKMLAGYAEAVAADMKISIENGSTQR